MTAMLLLAVTQPFSGQFFEPVTAQQYLQNTPVIIFGVLQLCLAVTFFSLWRAAPDYRVFRSMSFFFGLVGIEQFWMYFGGTPSNWMGRVFAVAVLVQTVGEAMRIPNRRWTLLMWPFSTAILLLGWHPSRAYMREWPVDLSEIMLAILIVQALRHGDRRDRLIAGAVSVHFLLRATLSPYFEHLTGIKNYLIISGWKWGLTSLTITFMGAATLVIFVRDLIRDRREKQRLAAEIEAGRAVQQLLIPETATATFPGFHIQSVYRPMSEVGGDFFQVFGLDNRDVLIVIGDVSGKGLAAALTVSLLLGALQAVIDENPAPSHILTALNRTLSGRNRGGFTTCLVLRASSEGKLVVANAGHLAPYLAGAEMQLESGLPLGISADATYTETEHQFGPEDQLTMITDGVVEARGKMGELFGFARTATHSRENAESLAHVAQDFGQEDDITVLTLRRCERTDETQALATAERGISH